MTDAVSPEFVRPKRTVRGIRQIGLVDLTDAIGKGIADFGEVPTHYFYLAIIYPVVAFAIVGFYGELDLLPIIFPLVAGYTLLGPVVATGMYEISRRREFGRFTSWTNAFLVFKSHSINGIAILGVILMLIYIAWLFLAAAIYVYHFGAHPPESYMGFVIQLFTTSQGASMIIMGCGAGLVLAIIVLSFSVVSFPMLLDLEVGVLTAVYTSVKAVIANPIMMVIWGVIVAASLLVGSLPFFVGLGVVLPVLGHATWHLYRKMVDCSSD